MTTNKQRSAAVRAHMAANPGTSFTAATFAVKAQREALAKPERPDVSRFYGHLIIAKAPRRRPRRGLLLPPAPGSRSTLPRLQPEDSTEAPRWDPTGYEITPLYGEYSTRSRAEGKPVYAWAELPPKHVLATETTLRTEMRKTPGQVIAWYYSTVSGRRGYFALYATVDAKPMPQLSPKQQAAWDGARTCATCGKTNPSPFPNQRSNSVRYCDDCWKDARREIWIAEQRPLQLEQTEWAQEVLADPNVVLTAIHQTSVTTKQYTHHFIVHSVRIESLSGELLADLRTIAEEPNFRYDGPDPTNEKEVALRASMTAADEFAAAIERLQGRRSIGWSVGAGVGWDGREDTYLPIDKADRVEGRLACWAARRGYSHDPSNRPASLITVKGNGSAEIEPFTSRAWREADAAGRIDILRRCIQMIATEPPAPTYDRSH